MKGCVSSQSRLKDSRYSGRGWISDFDVVTNGHVFTAERSQDVTSGTAENVVDHNDVGATRRKGDGMLGIGATGEMIPAHGDVAVPTTLFVGREIEFGVTLVIAGNEAASTAPRIAIALGGVVHENVVRQDEVPWLVDPRTTPAISECVSDNGYVFTRLLHAHNTGAIGAIHSVSRDRRVLPDGRRVDVDPRPEGGA